jgi:predicted secreted hydrolase
MNPQITQIAQIKIINLRNLCNLWILPYLIALGLALALACRQSTASAPAPTPAPTATATPTPTPLAPTAPPPQGIKVTLPQDDASHDAAIEWWYFNGHLRGEDGSRYGFHYVFFQGPGAQAQTYFLLGQLAISDHQKRSFSVGQRFSARGEAPERGFRAVVGDWQMSGYDGRFELDASLDGYAIDLRLTATKPPVLHGGDGIVEMGSSGQSSYYHTYPRLDATGAIVVNGVEKPLRGLAWMDHQWGAFRPTELGWDWFSIQLDDNTEVMFFTIRDLKADAAFSFGTYVDPAGSAHAIPGETVVVRPLDVWRSPSSNTAYPSGWELWFGELKLFLRLSPLIESSEVPSPGPGVPAYWEGEVEVDGQREGATIGGRGFVELVGYDRTHTNEG